MTAPKVAIAIPRYRTWEAPSGIACMQLGFYSGARVSALIIDSSGCYVEDNRNGAVEHALATGIPFDWLFWIDPDMIFPPDALVRLIEHDKDIIGANYRIRTPPYTFCAHYLDGGDTRLLEPGLHRMSHLPTGLLLTRFDVYRKIPYPWFRPGLRNEPRDDIWFCEQARKAGYELWCDHDLTFQVRHVTVQEIPWFSKDQIIQVGGAELNLGASKTEANKRAALSREMYEAEQRR